MTQPTTLDQQKLKHLLRYIKGTQHYRFYVRPAVRTMETTPDLDVFVDWGLAGCTTTRKSTSGFVIKLMGSTIHFGSRTEAKKLHSAVQKQNCTPSTQEQQNHFTSETSYRKHSASRR